MKLMTLNVGGALRAGVQVGTMALDLVAARAVIAAAGAIPDTVRAILCGGAAAFNRITAVVDQAAELSVRERLLAAGALARMSDVRFGPIIPDPAMFLSIGANSYAHIAEMNDTPPPSPEFFFKVRSAIAASGDTIVPPADYADMLDWEGELCAVIGSTCHRVTPEEADDYIAGYTLTNDVSARNTVRQFIGAQGRHELVTAFRILTQLKNFPGFCPVGPVLATRDEFPDDWDYWLTTTVNGELMQESTKADLIFTPAQILSYFSEFYVFEAGDIFSLGSPPGVGMAMKPPRFLHPGDIVEVQEQGIGRLINVIGSSRSSAASSTRPR